MREQIKKRALRFAYLNDTLYRRSYDQLWLRCVSRQEAEHIMKEVHSGLCGAHQSGPKMRLRIKHLGYYWLGIWLRRACEKMSLVPNTWWLYTPTSKPVAPHRGVLAFWLMGYRYNRAYPPSSGGHRFILAATYYFSKRAEAIALKEVKASHVVQFVRTQVVYRFGAPKEIKSDNGTAFQNAKVYAFANQHKIDWKFSSIYNPAGRGFQQNIDSPIEENGW